MGRKIKQAFEYFPLDCDFFGNNKIKALRRAHGAIGIAVYVNILCRIYGGNGYYFRFADFDELVDDITEQLVSKNDRPGRLSASVRESIRYLIDHEILDRGLVEQSVLTGKAMQEHYVLMAFRSKRKADLGVYSLIDVEVVAQKNVISSEETGIYSEEIGENSEKSTQSKRESESKNINTNTRSIARTREDPSDGDLLSEKERAALIADGIPEEYIRAFVKKVQERGYRCSCPPKTCREWWERDRDRWNRSEAKPPKTEAVQESNFDTNDFFAAAVRRAYGKMEGGDHDDG